MLDLFIRGGEVVTRSGLGPCDVAVLAVGGVSDGE